MPPRRRKHILKAHDPLRQSRRIWRIPPAPIYGTLIPSTRLPYLPPEILQNAFAHLENGDLKPLRFVSQEWDDLIRPLLFQKIWISPHEKNVEVFREITRNPRLNKSIRKLVYDVCRFHYLDHEEYFKAFVKCIKESSWCWRRRRRMFGQSLDFDHLLKDVDNGQAHADLFEKHGSNGVILNGFKEWQVLRRYAWRNVPSGMFCDALSEGLQSLPQLRTVETEDNIWFHQTATLGRHSDDESDFLSFTCYEGSPISRNWKLFHPRPRKPIDGSKDFRIIVSSLRRAQRRIKNFCHDNSFVRGYPAVIFQHHDPQSRLGCDIASMFLGLTHLNLSITPRAAEFSTDRDDSNILEWFRNLLSSMSGLKSLKLDFSSDHDLTEVNVLDTRYARPNYTYRHVFSYYAKWKNLKVLGLSGLALHSIELFYLLVYQMPNIEILSLEHMELQSGTWDGAIMHCLRMEKLSRVYLRNTFRQPDSHWWPCTPYPGVYETPNDPKELEAFVYDGKILPQYQKYILWEARHPSLRSDQSDHDALAWWQDQFVMAGPKLWSWIIRLIKYADQYRV